MLATPDQQISLTDPDARSMATSGRGSGVVGYNVQIAVETKHHLIITHEVTNIGTDRAAARSAVGANQLVSGFVVTEFRRPRPRGPVLEGGSMGSKFYSPHTWGRRR